ncbi:MAG: hypothetical protein PHF61_08820, partial [Bacteroidales bacterium]|nr:hypothetical protein [Bacteroidales bacterium]
PLRYIGFSNNYTTHMLATHPDRGHSSEGGVSPFLCLVSLNDRRMLREMCPLSYVWYRLNDSVYGTIKIEHYGT